MDKPNPFAVALTVPHLRRSALGDRTRRNFDLFPIRPVAQDQDFLDRNETAFHHRVHSREETLNFLLVSTISTTTGRSSERRKILAV